MKAQEAIVLQKWQVARRPILDRGALKDGSKSKHSLVFRERLRSQTRTHTGLRVIKDNSWEGGPWGAHATKMKTSTTTSKICIINNGKQYFRTPCTSVFNFSTFCNRSRPIKDVKMTFSSCVDNVTIGLQICNSFHFRTLQPI